MPQKTWEALIYNVYCNPKTLTSKQVRKYTHFKSLSVKLCQHEAVHFKCGSTPHRNMGGGETVYNITAQAHSFTHSFILTVYVLYDTVFLNPFPHPRVNSFPSVDNKR